GATVTAQSLAEAGVITLPKNNDGVKILGNGELTKKLDVKAVKFTASAKEKIEKVGGTTEEV
ncbi:MAG: uL15 family ribosomal protein, partial [Clostridiales bacterium]|nr:uL15 family ribosomal protein [Clostridiales bacterium]